MPAMGPHVRTDCFFNLTTDEKIDIFKRRQQLRIESVFRAYWGWLMLPLALIGLVTTGVFIYVVYQAIRERRVSRKCYVLILNRAVGDLFCCIMALCSVGYITFSEEVNRDMMPLFESFFIGAFWSGFVSYAALSILKFFAVWKPLHYRKYFTMKRCIYLSVMSWICLIFVVTLTLGVTALVKVPFLNEWSHCRMETCLRTMYRTRNSLVVALYFITLFVFGVTVLLIRRAQRFSDSFKRRDDSSKSDGGRIVTRARFPLWKLALNIATFAGLNFFYVIWCVGLLLNQNQCFFQQHYAEMMRILAIVRCFIILRCVIDPMLSFVTDFQLRRGFLILIGKQRRVGAMNSRGAVFQKSNVSDSSAADQSTIHNGTGGINRIDRSQTVSTMA